MRKCGPDALAVTAGLPMKAGGGDFVPEVVRLARALQAEGRMQNVAWVLTR
ncbi:MAG: hypothetical protein J6386_10640 [Candidatus Synoicihabitans palmerolidicus]|nr:hypothetical protein [Candidatus Synoicihabitans palmerolidicus]